MLFDTINSALKYIDSQRNPLKWKYLICEFIFNRNFIRTLCLCYRRCACDNGPRFADDDNNFG